MNSSDVQIQDLPHRESLGAGVKLRNANSYDDAELYLINASEKKPEHWQAYFELGILYKLRGNAGLSFDYFKKALVRQGYNIDVIKRLLASAVSNNSLENFQSVVEAVTFNAEAAVEAVCAYRDLFSYVEKFKLQDVHQMHDQIVSKSLGWYSLDKVISDLQDHYVNKVPYAFIRFGDGEGTWGHFSAEDEMHFHTMYRANRNEFWNIWFGQSKIENRDSFFSQMRRLEARMNEANVIGVPPKSWISHEYSTGSLRGIPGTANVIRNLSAKDLHATALCTQLMHYELSDSGSFFKFLGDLETVTIITCHPETVDVMKAKFNIPNVVHIAVPGEPSRSKLLGETSIRGEHYPTYFESNMALISSMDWAGKVCLVGGGILGKIYCLEIKKNGGIAIDIGSVMDKWNNKKTRPGF